MVLRAGFHGTVGQSSAQVIDGSLRFDDGNNQYLKRTAGSGNQKTYTFSTWIKKGDGPARIFGDYHNPNYQGIDFSIRGSDDAIEFHNYNGSTSTYVDQKISNDKFRDTGWYHVMFSADTTESASEDKFKIYVNGRRITSWATNTVGTATNGNTFGNTAVEQRLGYNYQYSDQTLTQTYFIDGQALGPENFGFTDPLTNTWRPKKFSGEFTVDDGYSKTWTNEISGTEFNSSNPKKHAFDGNLSTWTTATNGNSLTWTPSGGLAVSSSLRIYAAREAATDNITVTFTDTTTFNTFTADNTFRWYTITGAGGKTIDNIAWSHNNTFSRIAAIEVDGTILTDLQGTNSFYLPMDGNSPIGQDKSGRGNDWTPVNFGGSNSLEKATGALPILNTTPGGVSASVGVRTDANASSLALALPLASDLNAVTNQINSGVTNRTILSHNSPSSSTTKSNFYGRSYYLDGSQAITIGVIGTDLQFQSDDFTMEMWFNSNTTLNSSYWNPIVSFPWHGGTNENSQLWIGFAGGAYLSYSTGELHARIKTTSGIVELPTGILTAYNDNAWHHVAVTRNGSTASIYVDGALRSTASISGSLNTSYGSYEAFIGAYDHGGGGFNGFYKGYVSDFRVYKGAAKYTSDFVVPSTNPTILPDTPSGVSGGSKLTKITEGAVSMDVPGNEHLSVAASEDFNFGTGDFTIEGYFYINSTGGNNCVFDLRDAGSNSQYFLRMTSATAYDFRYSGSSLGTFTASNKAWNHIAVSRSSGTTKIFVNGVQTNSFSDTNDASNTGPLLIGTFKDTTTSASSYGFNGAVSNFRVIKGTALYTSNFTPPTEPLTNITNTKLLCCQSNTSAVDTAVVPGTAPNTRNWSARTNWNSGGTLTNASSYPLTAAFDGNLNTTFAMSYAGGMIWTAPATISFSSSIEVYVNSSIGTGGQGFIATISGVQQSKVDLSAAGSWETVYSGSGTFDKLEMTRNDGGNNNNLWISAIRVDGTVLVDAIAGNGDAAATTFNPFNTDINTVRGQETGYATWNPLKMGTSDVSMSEGNLFWRTTSNGPDKCTYSTIGMDSGKFYWENEIVEATATAVGIANVHANQDAGPANAHNWMYYSATGQVYLDGSASSYGAAYNTNGTIIGVAFDRDNLTLEFYKNGISQGKLTNISGLTDSETYFAMCGDSGGASQSQVRVNFGQKPFKFPPPDGFQPLNGANVRPETVIARPDQYFGTILYTGNGDTKSISGLNFGTTPDLVWIKSRSASYNHYLVDTVRGFNGSNANVLQSNLANAQENADGIGDSFASFDRNGFTAKLGTGNWLGTNANNVSYVAWCWKAGGSKNTFNVDDVGYATATAAGLTAGDSSSVTGCSIGTKQGFSIIQYSGSNSAQQIPHGLGHTPDLCIVKNVTTGSTSWVVSAGNENGPGGQFSDNVMILNSTAANNTGLNGYWNTTNANSTVVYVGGNQSPTNQSSSNYIMYNWINVPGLQKFGTYEGTGVAGNYVHLGFRPALIWIKNADSTSINNWGIIDSTRSYANVGNHTLATNLGNLESYFGNGASVFGPNNKIDLLSDGFALRETSGFGNASGITFLYCAWAEAPTFNLYGGQSNAR